MRNMGWWAVALAVPFFLQRPVAAAQEVANVVAFQQEGNIGIAYDLLSLGSAPYHITLHVSADGGKTYKKITRLAEGDVNKLINPGKGKMIQWKFADQDSIKGDKFLFSVKAASAEMQKTATHTVAVDAGKPSEPKKADWPKFEDLFVKAQILSINRSGTSVFITISIYNDRATLVRNFFNDLAATDNNGRIYRNEPGFARMIAGNLDKRFEIYPRVERNITFEVLNVAPTVTAFSRFEVKFGHSSLQWKDLSF